MKLGFYISFAGPVVFSKSIKLKEVAADIPMDRLLIETDSPYLTPPPYRGKEMIRPTYSWLLRSWQGSKIWMFRN